MKPIRLLSAATGFATAIWLAFSPAFAADPVFPSGHRVGLVPIKGLVISKTFPGFETEDHGVKVLIAELPPSAYGEVQNAFKMNFFSPAGSSRKACRPPRAKPFTRLKAQRMAPTP